MCVCVCVCVCVCERTQEIQSAVDVYRAVNGYSFPQAMMVAKKGAYCKVCLGKRYRELYL